MSNNIIKIKGIDMMPQKQTILGPENGNCYPACLATILCLPINQIPNFYNRENRDHHSDEEINAQIRLWLLGLGLDVLRLTYHPSLEGWVKGYNIPIIVTGPSPRHQGCQHAVVYVGNEMVFDPAPEGNGVAKITDMEFSLCLDARGAREKNWLRKLETLWGKEADNA